MEFRFPVARLPIRRRGSLSEFILPGFDHNWNTPLAAPHGLWLNCYSY